MSQDQTDLLLAARCARATRLCQQACAAFADIPTITYTSAQALGDAKPTARVLFIDVRSQEEMDVSMLPDAISRSAFESLALDPQVEAQSAILVPYCTIGYRSGEYGKALLALGWDKSCVFNGLGVVPFSHESGFRLVSPGPARAAGADDCSHEGATEQATMRMHVFGSQWDVAHPAYETRTFSVLQVLCRGALHLLHKWVTSVWG